MEYQKHFFHYTHSKWHVAGPVAQWCLQMQQSYVPNAALHFDPNLFQWILLDLAMDVRK